VPDAVHAAKRPGRRVPWRVSSCIVAGLEAEVSRGPFPAGVPDARYSGAMRTEHMYGMATIRPSDRARWMSGSAEGLLGCPFKIESKNQRGLEPLYYLYGKLADPAFETHTR
jgi:hypothetical protein